MPNSPLSDALTAEEWDTWWRSRLADGPGDRGPIPQQWFSLQWGTLFNLACDDALLVHVMRENGLRSVLCAGNGVSREARELAAAGFDVTALDISRVAVECAESDTARSASFVPQSLHRPGGRLTFIVGDLRDPTVCSGPFDVVIERRTVERFPEPEWASALTALAARLPRRGIFLSMCDDDNFPADRGFAQHPSGWFHASEPWFREQGWPIWDGAPHSSVTGRVAWVVRIGGMKRAPDGACGAAPRR